MDRSTRPPSRRPALGDATRRVNNAKYYPSSPPSHKALVHHESLHPAGQSPIVDTYASSPLSPGPDYRQIIASPGANAANPRLSAISKEHQEPNSNRNSQISTTSTNASDGRKRKTHIGPWNLGKTLGEGATARVRLARHAYTGQAAAVKIVMKNHVKLAQAGSLAALNSQDAALPEDSNVRRMPYGIEREVAIMKLIEHPHIMKLYDIWENRTEM